MRPIQEQVIVITGGSSGVGRAAALKAAKAGARVALAARNAEALTDVARQIEADGGAAIAVPTDVADNAAVEALADRTVSRFGRIDTWVNDAGTAVYGEFLDISPDEFREVIAVDLLGTVHGCRAALRRMRDQAGGGAIVNISSEAGVRGVPLMTPYCAAKFGVDGFSEALRVEIEHNGWPVNLTVIRPASIDTPFFHHARSKLGVEPKPIPPVYDPDVAADAILYAATHSVRDLPVGGASAAIGLAETVAPGLVDATLARSGYRMQRSDRRREPGEPDNLFAPVSGPGAVRGGYDGRSFSVATWFDTHPNVKRAAWATMALAALAAFERSRLSTSDEARRAA
jgi:NAD(P)-dependent dehydrogenase (short-subunit alcohol dehydrogenase family)